LEADADGDIAAKPLLEKYRSALDKKASPGTEMSDAKQVPR
jgi:hypothetical protein